MRKNAIGYGCFRYLALAAALLSGVWLAGCGSQIEAQPAPVVPEVATVTLRPQRVELTTELPGRTSAYRIAEIRPQVSPSIRLKVERYKELIVDKAVSQQDYDDALAAVEQARAEIEYWKAQVEAARINLNYARVTAPFAGRIGKTHVRTGTVVTAYQSQPFATVQQLNPIYVDVAQSSAELLRLRRSYEAGQLSSDAGNERNVRLVLEDGTAYPLEGKLQFRDVTVDPMTGSYSVRIVVPNPNHLLLPGMFVRAIVQEGVAEQAILAPQQGVSRTAKGEPFALIVDESGTVRQRMLTLNRAIGDKWLIASGLSDGDRVIVEGSLNVRPGVVVKAVPLDSPKGSANASPSKRLSAGSN